MRLGAVAVALAFVVGCGTDRATPSPDTPLPPLPPIAVTVTTTTIATVPTTLPQPVTSLPVLTDVYGLPIDSGVTVTVSPPPPTTAPRTTHPPKTAPPAKDTAPPTTDCPTKKHRRRCKP